MLVADRRLAPKNFSFAPVLLVSLLVGDQRDFVLVLYFFVSQALVSFSRFGGLVSGLA